MLRPVFFKRIRSHVDSLASHVGSVVRAVTRLAEIMAPERLAEIPEAGKGEAAARELKPRPSKARLAPDSAPQAAASAEHREEPGPPEKKRIAARMRMTKTLGGSAFPR